jgi:hypothetical protein
MHAEHDPALSSAERQQAQQLRARFEQAAAETDAVARARLAAARRRALETADGHKARAPLWIGAALAAGVIGALTLQWLPDSGGVIAPSNDPDALEWMVAEESPELIQDLEFYEWLDSEIGRS